MRRQDRAEGGHSAANAGGLVAAVSNEASRSLLTGLFPSGDAAERAYESCVARGYAAGDINVVVSEGTRKRLLTSADEPKAQLAERDQEGGELGGPKGGRVGILMTIFAAVGAAVALPTVGFVAGPLAVALAAAGAAGVAAGLIHVFADWGVPPERIERYEAGIREGSVLVMVATRSGGDARQIAEDWKKLGGRDIFYR
jgi:hypothetical protein